MATISVVSTKYKLECPRGTFTIQIENNSTKPIVQHQESGGVKKVVVKFENTTICFPDDPAFGISIFHIDPSNPAKGIIRDSNGNLVVIF